MIYLLDTNTVSDFMKRYPEVRKQSVAHVNHGDQLAICRPIYYEVLRGLLWRDARLQLKEFQNEIRPLFQWIELEDTDWEQAAQFWADARRNGKQIGDPDLLLAAMAYRLNAIVVSADADFDALPIRRENWRA
jgi:tRNA(fMet)-specific endonuclease VapC